MNTAGDTTRSIRSFNLESHSITQSDPLGAFGGTFRHLQRTPKAQSIGKQLLSGTPWLST